MILSITTAVKTSKPTLLNIIPKTCRFRECEAMLSLFWAAGTRVVTEIY
jgi:hypothetical protein